MISMDCSNLSAKIQIFFETRERIMQNIVIYSKLRSDWPKRA